MTNIFKAWIIKILIILMISQINNFLLKAENEFSFSVGYPCGMTSDNFFEIYQAQINKGVKDFSYSPVLRLCAKFPLSDNFRLNASLDYFMTELEDGYNQKAGIYNRNFSQSFTIASLPIFISLEALQVNSQFRSYCGFGLGFMTGKINWEEEVFSLDPNDPVKGGSKYNEISFYPAFNLYCGLELGFDDRKLKNVVGSLIFEISFVYSDRKPPIFKNINEDNNIVQQSMGNSISLIPYYFSFNFGLSFYINRL